ncbi:MAG TPA: ABC transporter substrate-binding protein [Chloroflexota bacterium]|nr:ABC transporter substrate-binding protein [Chloroflexota bacterium]
MRAPTRSPRRVARALLQVGLLGLLVGSCAAPLGSGGGGPGGTTGTAIPSPAPSNPTASPASPAQSSPTAPAARENVRQGILGTVSDAGALIAIARGYFTEAGIAVERTTVPSGVEAVQFLATGQLDVLGGGPGAGLFNAFAQGIRVRVVADKGSALDDRFGLNPVLVRQDLYDSGQLRDYSQFGGRRIALSGATGTSRVDLDKMLERGGLGESDIELVTLSFPDMIPALANGSVDVAIANEPSATAGIQRGVAVRLGTVADVYPNHQAAMLMFSEQFATNRNEVARRYMVAYVRGLRDYNDAFRAGKDKAEIIAILGAATGVTDPAIYDAITLPGLKPDGAVFKASVAEDQDWYLRLGLQHDPVSVDQLVDSQFTDYALQQLGPYAPPR